MERSDEDLIRAFREGNQEAFGQLLDRYGPPLLGYLRHMTGNDADADDLFQETFRRVLARLDNYDGSRPFKPWLFRIAKNLTIDEHRKRARRPDSSNPTEDMQTLTEELEDTSQAIWEQADTTDRKALVRRAVQELPPRQRETLILAYFHGMSYPQVAESLDCTVGTVKTQMSRALRTLAKHLPPAELRRAL